MISVGKGEFKMDDKTEYDYTHYLKLMSECEDVIYDKQCKISSVLFGESHKCPEIIRDTIENKKAFIDKMFRGVNYGRLCNI